MCTVSGDGEDCAVEHVHCDVDGVGGGGLTRVDARVGVLDVPDDEARHGAAAGVVLEAVRGHRLGRRRGRCGAGVEEDHLQSGRESRTKNIIIWGNIEFYHSIDKPLLCLELTLGILLFP